MVSNITRWRYIVHSLLKEAGVRYYRMVSIINVKWTLNHKEACWFSQIPWWCTFIICWQGSFEKGVYLHMHEINMISKIPVYIASCHGSRFIMLHWESTSLSNGQGRVVTYRPPKKKKKIQNFKDVYVVLTDPISWRGWPCKQRRVNDFL